MTTRPAHAPLAPSLDVVARPKPRPRRRSARVARSPIPAPAAPTPFTPVPLAAVKLAPVTLAPVKLVPPQADPASPPLPEPVPIPLHDPLAAIEELQRQLADVRNQLTQSQRLATIGTIAAVIAHEFNNLLTPIVSYAQFALSSAESETPDLPLIRKALSKSYQSSTKAGKICTSMLALARGESTFGRVPVQHLVDEVLSVLARDPQKDGIALRVQVQPGLTVVGDAVQLEQVLLNLLINAKQALESKIGSGAITIKASLVEVAAEADGSADDPATAGEVRLQVIDNGPGIPAAVLPKIFDPFFTTKGTAAKGEPKGTGLGLAICREIVTHHGGLLEVESSPGKGATFTLRLPPAPAGE